MSYVAFCQSSCRTSILLHFCFGQYGHLFVFVSFKMMFSINYGSCFRIFNFNSFDSFAPKSYNKPGLSGRYVYIFISEIGCGNFLV